MIWITLIVLIAAFAAWRKGRPLRWILTEEEAARLKDQWKQEAIRELKTCAVIVPIFCLVLGGINWMIIGGLMLAFSRLAIWLVLCAGVLWYLISGIGHVGSIQWGILAVMAALMAMAGRLILGIVFRRHLR